MSIIFVTQKNAKIGVGHYVRSNLVKTKIKIKSFFILNNKLIFDKKSYDLKNLSDVKIKMIFKEIKLKIIYFDIHILDSLHKRIINLVMSENIRIIFYDYHDTIVKNANVAFFTPSFYLIKNKFFPKKKFVGWKYLLLNKNKKKIKFIKKFDILLSFGGSDPNRITEFVLKFFLKFKFNLKICCLIGYLNKRKKEIKEICNKSDGMIKFYQPKKNIDKYINESNFAIISVGLTAYETIFFNTPAMFIPIKKIDIKLAKYFETLKLGVSTPYFKNLNYSILKNKLKNLTNNKKIILHKKKIIDGKGLDRVVHVLLKEHKITK